MREQTSQTSEPRKEINTSQEETYQTSHSCAKRARKDKPNILILWTWTHENKTAQNALMTNNEM